MRFLHLHSCVILRSIGWVSGHRRLTCIAGFPSYVRGHREMVTRRLYLDPELYPRTPAFLHEMCTFRISLRHSGGQWASNQRFERFPERFASRDGDSALVGFARTASRSSGEWSRFILRRNRGDAEETATRLLHVCRSCAWVADKPSCQEGAAAGCFPVLEQVIRAISSAGQPRTGSLNKWRKAASHPARKTAWMTGWTHNVALWEDKSFLILSGVRTEL